MSPTHQLAKLIVLALSAILLSSPYLTNNRNLLAEEPPHEVSENSTSEAPKTDFTGKTVGTIQIIVRDIFDNATSSSTYGTINKLKFSTLEHVVRQELLFSEGSSIDEFLIKESVRNLRTLRFLRHVEITPSIDGDLVNLTVTVQDTWTLIPQLAFSSGTGSDRVALGVGESDLFGYGKRLEMLYAEEDKRQSFEGVWDDNRVWGSNKEFLLGVFDRNDGERFVTHFGKPFRSFVDKTAWSMDLDNSDTIGRLFDAGDESFIFRTQNTDFAARYTVSRGNPEILRRRYTYGYGYQDAIFTEADANDFDDLDLNPNDLNQDSSQLASDRRFSGPLFGLDFTEPKFISMNYIDRFDRIEDYNLGLRHAFNAQFATELLGSLEDALLVSGTTSRGKQFNYNSFIRGEMGIASRFMDGRIENTLLRGELKYYNVLGLVSLGDLSLGRHTLAISTFIDFGDDLDLDRQLRIGGDNALRGYEARTFTGDKRFAINIEDRVHLFDDVLQLISVGAASFIDIGGATYESLGDMISEDVYSSAGVGLRFAFPRSSGGRVLRADLSFPFRTGPDGSEQYEPRLIVSGGQLFDSFMRSERVGSERASVDVGFDR